MSQVVDISVWMFMKRLFVVFFLFFAACTPNQKHLDAKDTTELKERLTDYQMKMRWGMYEQASQYVDPRFKQAFIGEMEERGEDYKIVSIEAKNVVIDGVVAEVEYEMEWHSESMVVKKDKFIDRWVQVGTVWLRQDSMTKDEWRKKKIEKETAAIEAIEAAAAADAGANDTPSEDPAPENSAEPSTPTDAPAAEGAL